MAVDRSDVARWVERYVSAWGSNDPEEIGGLFAPDGRYFDKPQDEPWRGRDTIVQEWLARKDEPGQWTWRYEVVAWDPDERLGVVRGWASYVDPPPRNYHNLWLIRLDDDGACTEFTEWWIQA
jgi:uncharacterized protein (TIGR02246 family)